MMRRKNNLLLLLISQLSFAMVAICLFAIYFSGNTSEYGISKFRLACGIGFWLFCIIGIALQIVVSTSIKRWCKGKRVYSLKIKKPKIGLLSFFRNKPATISDITMFVSFIIFVILLIVAPSSILAYILLAVLFLSFSAHCIFNGKNYYYITNYERIKARLTKLEEK